MAPIRKMLEGFKVDGYGRRERGFGFCCFYGGKVASVDAELAPEMGRLMRWVGIFTVMRRCVDPKRFNVSIQSIDSNCYSSASIPNIQRAN